MDILDPGSEVRLSDAGPWAPALEMIFAAVQGPVPPAPMQLELARQARSLVEEIVLAPLEEAAPAAGWVAAVQPSSVVLISGERSLVAQLQLGSVVTLDIAIPDQAAWSMVWSSPGADAESLLTGLVSPGFSPGPAGPAVRIGIFQGDRRVAETSFDEVGGWQDDLDDRALTDEVNRRLEEAGQGVQAPEEGAGPGAGPALPSPAPPASRAEGAGSGLAGVSGGALAGAAAAVAGVAAAALAREIVKKREQSTSAASPPPAPSRPTPPAAAAIPPPAVSKTCPACGTQSGPSARFCRSCGSRLA
ncbi:MAG: zinc ribbon domain-containing protein [Acidobacteriota bacterium]